ncbi:hypothetical protein FFT09_01365 [Saccharomonospora piscinae]|uniref:hypothetical protein n=1 Tax=Saccharomonospora piscinae TaxID=687388 RepID=UPI001106A30B|nr:hypothetical protein [Saccharomonospora piscinae]TLW94570.1 hypothetical protein FFT09_01365 [Saccharomonospora piscinae]
MTIVTLAQRPDLAVATFAIPYPPGSPRFMEGNLAGSLARGPRVARRWPHLVVALLDGDRPIARGVMVAYRSDRDDRAALPDLGWDQTATWAAEDALDDIAPDTACALEIAVHPERHGHGDSTVVLNAMREAVGAAGLETLVIPVRPPDKATKPMQPMHEYAGQTRADGLPADRWLRTHVRAGGRIETIASCSMTVQAPLAQWRHWTGLPFDSDGPVAVEGALAPVLTSTAHNIGVYVEANVWITHTPA